MAMRRLRGQKTYWHLLEARRVPTRYEVTSSRLAYRGTHAAEVATPARAWLEAQRAETPLELDDWDRFADPRATTYASYVALQREGEAYLDGVLAEAAHGDERLTVCHARRMGTVLSALRHPYHALMMISAYLGSTAPAGRITIAAALQAADEMRRVHRLAERTRMLEIRSGTEVPGRSVWEEDAHWQPFRELVERLLVVYDFGECFAALTLAVKPVVDDLVFGALADVAEAEGDSATRGLLRGLGRDSEWHRAWSAALVKNLVDARPENRDRLVGWTEKWRPRAEDAIRSLAKGVGVADAVADDVVRRQAALLEEAGAAA